MNVRESRKQLTGRVHFHCHISNESNGDAINNRKRPLEVAPSEPAQHVKTGTDNCSVSVIGWIFKSSINDSLDCEEQLYLLSVPQCYESILCDACRFHLVLHIVHYEIIPISKDSFPLCNPCSKSEPKKGEIKQLGKLRPVALICVDKHVGALVLPAFQADLLKHTTTTSSLEQLAQSESSFAIEKDRKFKKLFTIKGTIAFISPFLAVESNDPFVLVELIQEIDTSDDGTSSTECWSIYSAVVVLRHDALQCASSMTPNDSFVFINACKTQWRVPEVLMLRQQRDARDDANLAISSMELPPKSVFVIDSPMQILFLKEPRILSSSLSSKITTIEGVVKSVQSMKVAESHNGNGSRTLHILELMTSQRQIVNLLVTYFPMPTALQCLLLVHQQHVDIQICLRASNIENLGYHGYGASLYSHLALVSCTDLSLLTKKLIEPLSIPCIFCPFHFSNQWRSYHHFWVRRMVMSSVINDLRESWLSRNSVLLPSHEQIMEQFFLMIHEIVTLKPVKRNVYAEFFSRPICFQKLIVNNDHDSHVLHNMNDTTQGSDFVPFPVRVRLVQETCFELMMNRLKLLMEQFPSAMRVGWRGSIQLIGRSLHECLVPDVPWDECVTYHFYTFGGVDFTMKNDSAFSSVSNGAVIIPIVLCEKIAIPSCNGGNVTPTFAWTRIQSISVTCICMGSIAPAPPEHRMISSRAYLPPYGMGGRMASNGCGSSGVCIVDGNIFLVSVFLVCDQYHPIVSTDSAETNHGSQYVSRDNLSSVITVEQCLNPELFMYDETSVDAGVIGLLTRGSFKSGKVKSGVYSNYTMTLSHIPANVVEYCSEIEISSTLQSIELKPTITLDASKIADFRDVISSLIGDDQSISEERLALGVVWWKLASCPWTCALLGGGWDEFVPQAIARKESLGAVVHLPSSSIYRDPNRGYTRFRCNIDSLVVSMHRVGSSENITRSHQDVDNATVHRWFDFEHTGVEKFLAGMLDRRPRRRKMGGIARGELLQAPNMSSAVNVSGIQPVSLGDLTALLCLDLQSPSKRIHLAPSLTREVRRATFMGISYCRARAECSLCYATLCNPLASVTRSGTNLAARKEKPHPATMDCLPLHSHCNLAPKHTSGNQTKRSQASTVLKCPNGCRVDLHGTIKWECSGVLDDGSGQAKLYAEREAALCLLGVTETTVAHVETALWQTGHAQGFVYTKNTPPPSYLRIHIESARALALQHIKDHGKDVRQIKDADVIQFLSPGTYGEYLLHQHCRTSQEPMRELIYYVRCKPLSDAATALNQSEIEVVKESDTDHVSTIVRQTFTLPPLQLHLVDCSGVERLRDVIL